MPFVTFAHATAAGDYRLACEQIATATSIPGVPVLASDVAAAQAACARALRSETNRLDPRRRRSLASTQVVQVRLDGDHARVTVQFMLYGVAPRATGIAIRQDGQWKIGKPPSGAHVGGLLVYTIPSEGMAPTLNPGDTILVNPAAYRHTAPRVGDIVIFHPPAGAIGEACGRRPPAGQACATATPGSSAANFVKRIVAGPGDRFSMRHGVVIRNGKRAVERFIRPCGGRYGCEFPRPLTVAAGRYYLLGDNRGGSDDSRFWGPVAAKSIVGRVRRLGP